MDIRFQRGSPAGRPDIVPAFDPGNSELLFGSAVSCSVFLSTFKYVVLTWALTLGIGFTVAYFLAFHIRSTTTQVVRALICTVSFWTSKTFTITASLPPAPACAPPGWSCRNWRMR